MTSTDKISKPSPMLTLASIAVVVASLYLAKGVLVPLTLAVLLSFLLSPVCTWLEHRWLGRIQSVLVTAILSFTLLGGVTWTAAVQITGVAPRIPEYQKNIEAKLSLVNAYAVTKLRNVTRTAQAMGEKLSPTELADEARPAQDKLYSVRVVSSPPSPLQIFGGMFGTLLEVLGTIGIVIVLVVFFLVQREDLRDRFIHLIGISHVTVTTQMLEDAGERVSRYLSMLFLVNVTFGVSVSIGLYLIGLPNAVLWGILAAILRFVPYIGPLIAAAMPLGLSLAISPDWIAPLLAVSLFVVLELISNNLLEPWLYGRNTGVSAVAVLVAAVFWMWLWGPVGLLLATPLTVCLLVVGKHVPQLSFLGILLGNDSVFEPRDRIYQRLVAGDQEEAVELFEGFLEHQSLIEVYDTVLIPALALAEKHWRLGELSDGKHEFIMESLKEMVQDQDERQQEPLLKEATADAWEADRDVVEDDVANVSHVSVLCLPARSEADEIAALMLGQVLESRGFHVRTVSATALAGDMVDLLDQCTAADVVCVSATPPAAVMHGRYLSRRLRSRLPDVNLVVGLWDAPDGLSKAEERIGCDAIVVATLTAAQEHLRGMAPLIRSRHDTQSERNSMITADT